MSAGALGEVRSGISGWRYAGWRGTFYPPGLPQRRELEYASERLRTIEINGTFYSLQRPESFERWRAETPPGFLFSVKGPRYVTHMLRLRGARTAVANFFASGVLALGPALGPILWQLPERERFTADALDEFLGLLPRTTGEAARLARDHDARLEGRTRLGPVEDRPLRHALEPRHESFGTPAALELLTRRNVALVVADSAGRWPRFEAVTADHVYVRLHGSVELYTSGYGDEELDAWADLVDGWRRGRGAADGRPRDVLVYFDNDAKVHAPSDARRLAERLTARESEGGAGADA